METKRLDYKQNLCSFLDGIWDKAKKERTQLSNKLRSSKYLCLFGAGQVGQAVAYDLTDAGIKVDFFCDNNKELWGKNINQAIRCVSLQELDQHKNDVFVLVTTGSFKEICAQLEALGFSNLLVVPQLMIRNNMYWDKVSCALVKKNICQLIDILEDEKSRQVVNVIVQNWFSRLCSFNSIVMGDQYFPAGIINLSDDEVFVDVGAFNGDTLIDFLSRVNGRFAQAIAYELDKNCYRKLLNSINAMSPGVKERIIAYNLGLYDTNRFIGYIANTTSSSINSIAGDQGEVVRLDDHLRGKKVSFIKMDIEGAEVKALHGAEEILKTSRPKLAISVYHEPAHLWEVPLFIKCLAPDYKIYLRHHTCEEYETVCYAVL